MKLNISQLTRHPQKAQATVEFALLVGIFILLLLLIAPLIQSLFEQKSTDVHARAKATIIFNHGAYLGGIDNANIFLPEINLDGIFPEVPEIDWGDVLVPFIAGAAWSMVGSSLMDSVGFSRDTMLGNGFYYGTGSYIGSNFDAKAVQGGFTQGVLSSAQFGRMMDSMWSTGDVGWIEPTTNEGGIHQATNLGKENIINVGDQNLVMTYEATGNLYVPMVPKMNFTDAEGWVSGFSGFEDYMGNVSQGFIVGYAGSNGDINAGVVGGFGSGMQTRFMQDKILGSVGGSEFFAGVVTGGMKGGADVLLNGGDALSVIGTSAVTGGLSSRPVQDYINPQGAGFTRGAAGASMNGAMFGAVGYAKSGFQDPSALYSGAIAGAAGYTANKALTAGTSKVKGMFKDDDKSSENAHGDAKGGDSSGQQSGDNNSANPTSAGNGGDQPLLADGGTSPSLPESHSKLATDGSAPASSGGSADSASTQASESSAPATQESRVAAVTNWINNTTPAFGYTLAAGTMLAAMLVKDDSGSDGDSSANSESGSSTTNTTTTAQNSSSSASSSSSPIPGVTTKMSSGSTPGSATGAGTMMTLATGMGMQTLNSNRTSAPSNQRANQQANPLANQPLQRRMPQDVNAKALANGSLVKSLKANRNQAVNMVKMNVGERLLNDFRQQLVSSGKSNSEANTILKEPRTQNMINSVLTDPRVEEAIEQMIETSLQDENFLAALEQAKGDLTKMQALAAQMVQRDLERQKSSARTVYSATEPASLKERILDRLMVLSQKVGETI